MEKPKTPVNDANRLSELASYEVDYKLSDSSYDDLIRIASEVCQTPVAFISMITNERQCFKARQGFELDETPREYSFCAHLLASTDEFMEVPDARVDHRFHDNPYVTGYPEIVFYAGAPLINPKGYRLGTICVIDNKPGRLSESQVRSLKSLANQVVNLMELQKQQKELEQTKTFLEKKNEDLEKFAHRAAHDIKSPLKNINFLADYLNQTQNDKLDEEGRKMLQMVGRASEELENLVEGILSYTKSDKVLQENTELVQLPDLFEELKSLVDIQNVTEFDYPFETHTLFTNKAALKQILSNLVSNAIKYCDKTEAKITLDFDADTDHYYFFVTDNGPGISDEYQAQIFQIFEVLSNQDRHGRKGSGIGLATVQKLVEGLGGQVEVSSTVGEGTTFKVSLQKSV